MFHQARQGFQRLHKSTCCVTQGESGSLSVHHRIRKPQERTGSTRPLPNNNNIDNTSSVSLMCLGNRRGPRKSLPHKAPLSVPQNHIEQFKIRARKDWTRRLSRYSRCFAALGFELWVRDAFWKDTHSALCMMHSTCNIVANLA